jgi:hypothetical protein
LAARCEARLEPVFDPDIFRLLTRRLAKPSTAIVPLGDRRP